MFVCTFGFARSALASAATHRSVQWIIIDPWKTLRLTTVFLIGGCLYLFRSETIDRITWPAALTSILFALLLFLNHHTAELGLVVFGGPALFWFGLKADIGGLQRINDRWDLSYGVYLYGWPIAMALMVFGHVPQPHCSRRRGPCPRFDRRSS